VTVYNTSVLPSVIDALVAQAPAYTPTGCLVFDGYGITNDPGVQMLMVGVDDPDGSDQTNSGSSTQDWANTGNLRRDETGFITCAAVSWDGDAIMKIARDSAFAVVSGVEQLCRNNPTLGLANLLWTSFGGRTVLSQNQAQNGSIAVVTFRVNFRARL
jgi:hypothetical protein